MIIRHLCGSLPEEKDLLRWAIQCESSVDGECFDLASWFACAFDFLAFQLASCHFQISLQRIYAQIASVSPHLYIIPYDHHQGSNAPFSNKGNSSHFGVIVGIDLSTEECWVAHGLSSNICTAKLESFRASNAQLEQIDENKFGKHTCNKLKGVALLVCKSS